MSTPPSGCASQSWAWPFYSLPPKGRGSAILVKRLDPGERGGIWVQDGLDWTLLIFEVLPKMRVTGVSRVENWNTVHCAGILFFTSLDPRISPLKKSVGLFLFFLFFRRYFTTNLWYHVILPLNNLVYIYFRKNNLFHIALPLLHVIELAVILWSHLSVLRFPWLFESGSRQSLCYIWLLVPLYLF